MARGAGWHQQLRIDFNLYHFPFTNCYFVDEEEEGPEEPDDATGSRKVVVGKLACNIAMAIQLFVVVLSNFATGRFTFLMIWHANPLSSHDD